MNNTSAHLLALILRPDSASADPRLLLSYRRRAVAILRQWEMVRAARDVGIDCGVYNEVVG